MHMIRMTSAALAAMLIAAPALAQAPAAPAPAPAPSVAASAQLSESHMALARQLIELSGIGRSFDAAIPDIALRIRQNFANSRPEILKDMDDTLVALIPEVRTRRGELAERVARTVGMLLTEAELKDVVAFFNSSSGRRYVSVQPALTDAIVGAMEPWMQTTSDFFLNRFREEMRKKGHTV